jgi:hypothetical protein
VLVVLRHRTWIFVKFFDKNWKEVSFLSLAINEIEYIIQNLPPMVKKKKIVKSHEDIFTFLFFKYDSWLSTINRWTPPVLFFIYWFLKKHVIGCFPLHLFFCSELMWRAIIGRCKRVGLHYYLMRNARLLNIFQNNKSHEIITHHLKIKFYFIF